MGVAVFNADLIFLQMDSRTFRFEPMAPACDCERTTIQYYYPKKVFIIIEFLHKLVTLAERYAYAKL